MLKQRTLRQPVRATGVGLHSGRKVYMSLLPAGPDTGIVFRRGDRDGAEIAARFDNVSDTMLGTSLKNRDGAGVATVEQDGPSLKGQIDQNGNANDSTIRQKGSGGSAEASIKTGSGTEERRLLPSSPNASWQSMWRRN